jgi:tRNA (guanine-N7-)-methyltransferase
MKARYLSLRPFLPWRQVERPVDWARQFGRQAPLEVEIGFGNGGYLVRRARAHPERDFVGIEVEWASVRRALRKTARAEVTNVRLIQVDARVALARLFRPRSLDRVYALFPCPWPKDRHMERRLFSQSFLKLVNSRLVAKGEVRVVTDHQPYLRWMLAQLPDTGFEWRWRAVGPRFGTKYERKWRGQGQEEFYQLRLRKRRHLDLPVQKDVAVAPRFVERFDPERFRPVDGRGDVTLAFKEFFYSPARQKGLVRVVIVEGYLTQHLWIEAAREGNSWSVRVSQACAHVPTAGLQRALDRVRDAAGVT